MATPPPLEITLNPKVELISSFNAYTVDVNNSAETWTVLRRYRQFRSLHKELEHLIKASQNAKLPPFPPKKWFGNTKPNFVASRRAALQTYLQGVAERSDTSQSHIFRTFLDPKEKPAAMSLKSPKKEGSLKKKEPSILIDKWKPCWTVVANSHVYIFSSNHALEPLETMALVEITARVSPEHGLGTFEISLLSELPRSTTTDGQTTTSQPPKVVKTVILRAGSLEEAEEWVKVLRLEVKAATSILALDDGSAPSSSSSSELPRPPSAILSRPRSTSVGDLRGAPDSGRKAKGVSMRPDSIIKDSQTHKKRTQVVQEILTTEESYVNSLSVLIRLFLTPLRESALTTPILALSKIKTIFSEIEVIYNVNRLLLTDLKARMENWSPTQLLGDVFLQMIEFLKTYQSYVNNYNDALSVLTKELQDNKVFSSFLEKIYLSPECSGLSLQSFLIMPIQRVPRYVMLLDDLVKKTPSNHRDYQQLSQTLEKMRTVAMKLNDAKRDAESLTQVLTIQMRLVGKFENLVQPSRRFISEVEVVEEGVTKGKPARRLLLFNDLLVVTKMKKKKEQHYRYKIAFEIITSVDSLSLTDGDKILPQLQVGIDNGQKWVWTFSEMGDRDVFFDAISNSVSQFKKQKSSFAVNTSSMVLEKPS